MTQPIPPAGQERRYYPPHRRAPSLVSGSVRLATIDLTSNPVHPFGDTVSQPRRARERPVEEGPRWPFAREKRDTLVVEVGRDPASVQTVTTHLRVIGSGIVVGPSLPARGRVLWQRVRPPPPASWHPVRQPAVPTSPGI